MKHIPLILLTIISGNVFAQKETLDLIIYTPPEGWKKQPSESAVQFVKENTAKGTYCIITLCKSVPGIGDSKDNFDAAWKTVVKEMVTISADPEMQPVASGKGWETQSGYAPFESAGTKGIALLATSSGFEKMVNIIILTNTNDYEKNISAFLDSVNFKRPADLSPGQPANTNKTSVISNNNAPVVGIWGIGTTVPYDSYTSGTGTAGTTVTQYTFNANGTYSFIIKTFRYHYDKLLLTKETGTYQISGDNLTINPQKSIIQAWSKKDGTDNWGKLLSTQKKDLEKTTYRFFTQDFGSGMVLVLKADKTTKRDGPFNNSDKDAWFYPSVTSAVSVIKLPD